MRAPGCFAKSRNHAASCSLHGLRSPCLGVAPRHRFRHISFADKGAGRNPADLAILTVPFSTSVFCQVFFLVRICLRTLPRRRSASQRHVALCLSRGLPCGARRPPRMARYVIRTSTTRQSGVRFSVSDAVAARGLL